MTAAMEWRSPEPFCHEALVYAGPDEFLDGAASFIREGVANAEPMLVVVSAAKIDLLRAELNGDADRVIFADMAQVGTNPARIIPAWREFVDEQVGDGPFRGIGEPIWAGRSAAELVECQRHESLLNLAFAETPSFRLLCPYDTEALDPAVIEEACRSHPVVVANGVERPSTGCRSLELVAAPFDQPLPEPPVHCPGLAFQAGGLQEVRAFVRHYATAAALDGGRLADLLLAVNEIATNTLRHGGGQGSLRIWSEPDTVVCEVSDRGRIDEPLVGWERPAPHREGGRGLWMANHLCDLVQIRSSPAGSVVRLHVRRQP